MKNGYWIWVLVGVALIFGTAGAMSASSDAVSRLAEAIANAEGFYIAGSRAQRNNNPGDLTDTLGFPSIGRDSNFVIFQTIQDGWDALYRQVQSMFDGSSSYYYPDMTISQMAQVYAPGVQSYTWADNVARYLHVDINTKLSEI